MDLDIIVGSANEIQREAARWVYELGNSSGHASRHELRYLIFLVRNLAQTVKELATRVPDPNLNATKVNQP
jgi:hypothetical protein